MTSYLCPRCACRNSPVSQEQPGKRGLHRLRQCGACKLQFWTRQAPTGPERLLCYEWPGLNRKSSNYEGKVKMYLRLRKLIKANPDGREATRLRVALERARVWSGILPVREKR